MEFKDLKFEPHKVIPKKGIQATLEVKPQVSVSVIAGDGFYSTCLLYTSPSPRDRQKSRMPSSA